VEVPVNRTDGPASVAMTNVTCQWKTDRVVCSGVTARASAGEVLAIVGPVGSGELMVMKVFVMLPKGG
jgi:ABC-type transporter Mla maintaining outer membrane lipid asymmetry ATPase subunit MlaF